MGHITERLSHHVFSIEILHGSVHAHACLPIYTQHISNLSLLQESAQSGERELVRELHF